MKPQFSNTSKSTIMVLAFFNVMTCFAIKTANAQDSTRNDDRQNIHIDLGLSAGATLFTNGNEMSPYYSKYGFMIQIPLMAHWQFAPKWQLSAGLRYDFSWEPMYYEVADAGNNWDNIYTNGLTFVDASNNIRQSSYAFHSYVGIPIELKWHSSASNKNTFGIAFDLFTGYAVSQFFSIDDLIRNNYNSYQWEGYSYSTFGAMNKWKLELGITLSTNKLGLIHGVRFFTNILPTYTDPSTKDNIYLTGITMFL